jgi:hypothetical protein
MDVSGAAIETRYAGCRFRSRLEARWAVFFDHAGIRWEYEPQGFVVGGRPYLPDFLLPDCGTWVEVKGAEEGLDHGLMLAAAGQLPPRRPLREEGPRLMVLGPIPVPPATGDLGWLGIDVVDGSFDADPDERVALGRWWGFGLYHKNARPWVLCSTSMCPPTDYEGAPWLEAAIESEEDAHPSVIAAYRAARSARFEHGESGASR